jgi:hypothetical protein
VPEAARHPVSSRAKDPLLPECRTNPVSTRILGLVIRWCRTYPWHEIEHSTDRAAVEPPSDVHTPGALTAERPTNRLPAARKTDRGTLNRAPAPVSPDVVPFMVGCTIFINVF